MRRSNNVKRCHAMLVGMIVLAAVAMACGNLPGRPVDNPPAKTRKRMSDDDAIREVVVRRFLSPYDAKLVVFLAVDDKKARPKAC